MINVIVSGALGRMGGRIIPQILKSPDLQLTGAIERVGHDHIGQSVAEGIVLESDISGLLSGCDVLVEFTTPDATMAHLEQARREGVAVLIGTTGFTEIQEEMLKEASKDIAIIATHNYGFGMNVFNPALVARAFVYITFPIQSTAMWIPAAKFSCSKELGVDSDELFSFESEICCNSFLFIV